MPPPIPPKSGSTRHYVLIDAVGKRENMLTPELREVFLLKTCNYALVLTTSLQDRQDKGKVNTMRRHSGKSR